jgi:L-2-hydroxycarboxylate dehydrogenase (NAD+)
MEVERTRATETAAAAFEAYGIGAADARLSAEVLVSADARGKHSHGLRRLPRFVRGIEADNVDPDGEIEVVEDGGATATLDGGSRLGPVVASEAAVVAMDRANEHGIGCVGVHDSNHLGMLGYYTDELRRAGYVGIGMTNAEPAMPPHGGREPILGTNPIAIGLPTDPPFNLDMSTAAIARGTVEHRRAAGEPLPEGVALDADGEPTTDPAAALDGTIRPFGGAKGSGLAIAVEVLAGGLVGAAMGRGVTGTYHTEDPCTKGDLFVAIDPAAMGVADFGDRASTFLDRLRTSEAAVGSEGVRVPGERSVERDHARSIVEIDPGIWERVESLAGDR